MIKSNRGSGIGIKMSWWNKLGKGLINKKAIRKEDATCEENTQGICSSKVRTEPNWETASQYSKKVT